MKHNFRLEIIFIVLFLINYSLISGQDRGMYFTFNQISEAVFRKSLNDNFNATPIQLDDSLRLEKALQKIDKTYNQHELDLANRELYKSPRCLTKFNGYYPNLDILVFLIQDYHFENAVFIKENKDFIDTNLERFNGSYGVMSKKGLWVGLERNDCDNYLQIEISEVTERGAWSIINFDFKNIDINTSEKEPIIWINDRTIYLATIELNNTSDTGQKNFYEIIFDY